MSSSNASEIIDRLENNSSETPVDDYRSVLQTCEVDELSSEGVLQLYRLEEAVANYPIDTEELDEILEDYFSDIKTTDTRRRQLVRGMPENITFDEVRDRLTKIGEMAETAGHEGEERRNSFTEELKKHYLFAARDRLQF